MFLISRRPNRYVNVFKKNPMVLKFILNHNKTQKMLEITVDIYPASLKFVPDWIDIPKMLVIVDNAGLDKLIT